MVFGIREEAFSRPDAQEIVARLISGVTDAIVADLSRKEVLVRLEDNADRRRRIIDISPESRPAISQWLSPGTRAWRSALTPLTRQQQQMVVDTLLAYEAAFTATSEHASTD